MIKAFITIIGSFLFVNLAYNQRVTFIESKNDILVVFENFKQQSKISNYNKARENIFYNQNCVLFDYYSNRPIFPKNSFYNLLIVDTSDISICKNFQGDALSLSNEFGYKFKDKESYLGWLGDLLATDKKVYDKYKSLVKEVQKFREDNAMEMLYTSPKTKKKAVISSPNISVRIEYPDGLVYEGDFIFNINNDLVREGIGKSYNLNNLIKYEGEWKDDGINGFGIKDYGGGLTEKSFFTNGKLIGNGKLELHYSNGNVYIGNHFNGVENGEGVLLYKTGEKYEGSFKNHMFNGEGAYYNSFGKLIYKGSFVESVPYGYGIEYEENGKTLKGNFKNGSPDGSIIVSDNTGKNSIVEYKLGVFVKNSSLADKKEIISKNSKSEYENLEKLFSILATKSDKNSDNSNTNLQKVTCPKCNGTNREVCYWCNGRGTTMKNGDHLIECPVCLGHGYRGGNCSGCLGKGYILR